MQALKAELDYAMTPVPSVRHDRALSPPTTVPLSAPMAQPPLAGVLSPTRIQPQPQHQQQEQVYYIPPITANTPPPPPPVVSAPTPVQPTSVATPHYSGYLRDRVWEPPSEPIEYDVPLTAATTTTPYYDATSGSHRGSNVHEDYAPKPDVARLERRESNWDNSTAVEAFTPKKKKLRVGERPQQLYAATRPKSNGFYRQKGRKVKVTPEDEEYMPESPAQTRRGSSVRVPGGYGKYRPVRDRSPDMDLVTRAPKYFDANMTKSLLSSGGVLSDLPSVSYSSARGKASTIRTPLRGELSPVATRKGGLWATMPYTAKRLTKDYTAFAR
eukprot:TRINITY_DN1253_c2_g5_i1.p1 TRINITY_DN1253_c2_g5~~TRINITY_DN1253_c2_g5_i1.p1  ORF type:complete len:378 (+),score=58.41 TRINITY_DN1253_c2_g5_i1:151-1134(+)